MCQLSIYNSFPVIRTTIAKNCHFYVPRPSFFVCPGDAPVAITQNVARMKRQFSACQTPRSMYPSILNSFSVIRTASAKKCNLSRTAAHIFVSPGRPCDYHAICCMDCKTIQCLPNPSQHVPIYLQQFPSYSNRKCTKSPFFTYRSPHLFPLEMPLRLSSNMLHGWKDNSMLAKLLVACTYLYSIVSELYDA